MSGRSQTIGIYEKKILISVVNLISIKNLISINVYY